MTCTFRQILTATLVVLTVALIATLIFMSPYLRCYSKTGFVIDISGDLVTVQDGSRHLWKFWGAEDWYVGDMASMLMYDNGTPIIYDDVILSVRYAGFTAPQYLH